MQGMMHQESVRQQQAAEKDDTKQEIASMQDGFNQVLQAVQELAKLVTSPRKVVRDKTGRAVGVDVGGTVRQIERGPDGRVMGLQ